MGFLQEAVLAVGEKWEEIEPLNTSLERLRGGRMRSVEPVGDLWRSKIAWKVVGWQQIVLYRTVMLADACASMWNVHNTLGAILSARAISETAAAFWDTRGQMIRLCEEDNIAGLNSLVMKCTFATRLDDWLCEAPKMSAVSVLTHIDKLDKEIPGARRHYDYLSEICHPNSLGHHLMFSKLGRSTGVVALSDAEGFELGTFTHVIAGFALIELIETALDQIDELLPKIVELNVGGRTATE